MKTLTVHITNPASGEEVAWVRMSSANQLDDAIPQIGGPEADALRLPTEPNDLVTLGCLASAAASEAGLDNHLRWEGRWDLEPSTPWDRENQPDDEDA